MTPQSEVNAKRDSALAEINLRGAASPTPHPHTLRLIIERAYKASLSFAVLVLLGHIGWSLGSVIGEALR